MKTILAIVMILFSMGVTSQPVVPLNLKMPGNLFFTRTPGNQNGIKLTVKEKLPDVLLLASDAKNFGRPGVSQTFLNEKGRTAFLVAIPQLFQVTDNGTSKTFYFGRNSAENNVDLAVVKVFYSDAVPTPNRSMNRQPVMIGISEAEVVSVKDVGSDGTEVEGRRFLKAEVSGNETVTVEIDREANRGNVVIGIFSQRSGNLLEILDPKDPGNFSSRLAYTSGESVLVIPVIRPRISSVNGLDTIIFEVGDPREVATVEATEE